MMSFAPLALLLTLLSGGPNDLLDYLPSDAYWKQKAVAMTVEAMTAELKPAAPAGDIGKLIEELGSTDFKVREDAQKRIAAMGAGVLPQVEKAAQSADAEVASRAKDLIAQFKSAVKAAAVRRLMAIRALGELKNKDAAAALTPLLQSKAMFEAEYAAAALAAIEGKPYARPQVDAKTRAADINVLPDKLGLLAQAVQMHSQAKKLDIDELIKTFSPPGQNADTAKEQIVNAVLAVAEMVGNIRIDSVTVGLSEDLGDQTGSITLIARGQYDHEVVPQAMMAAFAQQMQHFPPGFNPPAATLDEIDGTAALKMPFDGPMLLFPDDQRLILTGGPRQDDKEIAKGVVASLKAGAGKIGQDAGMTQLLKGVDTTKPLWAVVRVNENYRQVPLLAGFDSLTLSVEPHGSDLEMKLTGTGSDASKVKAAVDQANGYLAQGIKGLESAIAQPDMKNAPPALVKASENALATMKGVKISTDGGKVSGTATIKDAGRTMIMLPAYWFMGIGPRPMGAAR